MSIDPIILIACGLILAAAAGAGVWAVMRHRIPAGLASEIAAVAVAVRAMLDDLLTEDRVKLLSGVLYDRFGYGSQHVDREKFCQLVWDLVKKSLLVDADAALVIGIIDMTKDAAE